MAFNLYNINKRQQQALALSLSLAAGIYLVLVMTGGQDVFRQLLSQLGITGWLILLSCSFSSYLLRFLRWEFYLNSFQHQLPRGLHFSYYLAGFALTTTPGKAGETIRSLYLKAHQVPFSHSLATFFTERFLDVIIITLLAMMNFSTVNIHTGFVTAVLLILLGLLPLMQSRLPLRLCKQLGNRFFEQGIGKLLRNLSDLLNHARDLLTVRKLYPGMLLGSMAWAIQGFAFYYLLRVGNTALPVTTALAIYALSLLAGALSFIPGGIGTTEGVMSLLLVAHGVDKPTAFSLPVINRIATLWFAVLLGLLSNSWLGLRGIKPDITSTS